MGHSCLWRSHAYSLGLNFSVSHRGPLFFGSGSLFVSSRNNRAASEIKSAGGLFEAQETVSWSIKKYSTISSSRIGFPFPSEGDITLQVRNANYTLGPVMLHVGMSPRRGHSGTSPQRHGR